MKLVIEFDDLGNDAFQPNPGHELARVMVAQAERLAWSVATGEIGRCAPLRDLNGNTFATVDLEASK